MIRSILCLTIIMSLFLFSCKDEISGPDSGGKDDDTKVMATFSGIQENVFTPTCAVSGCHNGTNFPDLREGKAYNSLVNQSSLQNPSMLLVKAGDASNSYLMDKLNGEGTTSMPKGMNQLERSVRDSITAWINKGAPNN